MICVWGDTALRSWVSSPHPSDTTHILHQQLLPRILSIFCILHSKRRASHTSPPGYVLLLVTDKPALGGLWFCGVDHFSQKEDALGIGGKDHHKEELVKPKGLVVVPGPKGDKTAGGPCSLSANFIHLQDSLVETLKGK